MGSSRLPGKVMRPIDGWPMIGILLQRLTGAQLVDTIVLAIPEGANEEPLREFHRQTQGIRLVEGPEDDVLSRVLKAARETKTDVIVEVTGDCPLLDPGIVDLCLGYFLCGKWDFVSNATPRTWPRGMEVRVFSTATLERVDREVRGDAREAYWREHVSPWIYDRPDSGYSCKNMEAPEEERASELNLSVDTTEDFRRVKDIVETLRPGNPAFSVRDVLQYLARLPGYEMLTAPQIIETEASWLAR